MSDNKSQNPQVYHFLISGEVQGVGYRRFVQSNAKKMNLNGWVRNLLDGRVELKVQLGLELLNEFRSTLQEGPLGSKVYSIDEKSTFDEKLELGFKILPDGESV